jgi:exopolyphosphatase/pppGpp-phosphohydrolase
MSPNQLRVIKLSCIISDLGWEQTAKIRASYAFNLILNSPLVGIEQSEKVFIAYLVYLRHTKNILDQRVIEKELSTYLSYLSSDEKKLAYQIGCVLNFLYSITKGSSFLLKQLDLKSLTLAEQKKVSSIQKVPKSGKTEQLYSLIRNF